VVCSPVARRRPRDRRLYSGLQHNNRGMLSSARSAKQQLNSNRITVFSVRSVPTCYKDNLSNELVVRQSPAGKNVDKEAEDIVGIRRKATTGKVTSD
jgi:hypothetical protein